jgi:hypothetical protein
MVFSQVGNHTHCVFPSDQLPKLNAYYNKYLLGLLAAIMRSWKPLMRANRLIRLSPGCTEEVPNLEMRATQSI